MLSRPARVAWAGWESDTFRLQQSGWEVSVADHYDRDAISLALRHETGMRGISRMHAPARHSRLADPFAMMLEHGRFEFQMEAMGHRVMVNPSLSLRDFERFQPVDCTPQYTEAPIKELEDLVYFAPLISKKRFMVPGDEVDHLMKRILDIQEPMREEYFREQAREAKRAPLLQAQIFSMTG
jgi:hypothetical protein